MSGDSTWYHMPTVYHNYVDGNWVKSESGKTFQSRNPAAPDDVIGCYQQSTAADTESAIDAAVAAADDWKDTPGPERGRFLRAVGAELDARADELTEVLVREEGKVLSEAAAEVRRAVDIFYYYAEKTRDRGGTVKASSDRDTHLHTREEPLGVAGLITPWNYPIAIPAWKLAPALAAGNTAVWKPASDTPEIGRKLIEIIDTAGIPDGVVNFVTGAGSEVGGQITTHSQVDVVSFTGSTAVGKHVYKQATETGKRVQTEMGGKNPVVVTESADADEAAEIVAGSAFGVTGQACTAGSRAIVDKTVYDEFLDALVEAARNIDVGPGLNGFDMGPQVNADELASTLSYVETGKNEGNKLVAGGDTPSGEHVSDGYFIEPTVFANVCPEDTLAQEEIFGPVVSVISSSGFEQSLEIANDVRYGLSSSIISSDNTEINRFADAVEAGVIKVNEKTTGLELHVPFGGVKDSSSNTFREQGDAGYDFYTRTKTVYHNY